MFFFLLFLSLILLFLDGRGWLVGVRGVLERPVLGLEGRFYSFRLSLAGPWRTFSYWRQGEEELFRLQTELQRLAVDQNQLTSCFQENERMKQLLGAPLPPNWKFMPVKVIGISDQMRIDKGESEGVEKGMMVVSENILVGRVAAVSRDYSLIDLVVTPGVKIPVVVKQPHSAKVSLGVQARGLLTGQSGQKLILDRVLQGEDIRRGDLVMSAGEAGWLPDLVIGQIEQVLPKTAAIYQKAQVRPLVDYWRLEIVFVVIKS